MRAILDFPSPPALRKPFFPRSWTPADDIQAEPEMSHPAIIEQLACRADAVDGFLLTGVVGWNEPKRPKTQGADYRAAL